jgi:hypothetical protein
MRTLLVLLVLTENFGLMCLFGLINRYSTDPPAGQDSNRGLYSRAQPPVGVHGVAFGSAEVGPGVLYKFSR